MTGGAAVLTACAGIMVALALGHRWAGRHSSRPGAALLAAALMASIAVPLMLRGPGAEAPQGGAMAGDGGGGRGPGRRGEGRHGPPRGRVARPDRPGGRRGTPPEFRAPARARRLAAPGHDAAHAAGAGLDRRSPPASCRSRPASGRPPPTRRWPAKRPSRCSPITVTPTRWWSTAFSASGRTRAATWPHGPLEPARRAGGAGRGRELVGDPAGARREGLPRVGPVRAAVRVGSRCREHRGDLAQRRGAGGRDGGGRGASRRSRYRRPSRWTTPGSSSRVPAPPTRCTNRSRSRSMSAIRAAFRPCATNAWTPSATTSSGTPFPGRSAMCPTRSCSVTGAS